MPFSVLYGLIVAVRNFLFNKKILRSASFSIPVICVGNLSVGGTGKSPMVELLIQTLKSNFQISVLSRGYGRKTKGYFLANENSLATEIGDEPLQIKTKFPEINVAVGEQRVEAIPQLLYDEPETNLIILDDAFQHRSVRAGFNILLTEFHHPYANDFFLPTGNLRDQKSSANRANIIVVTKCPKTLTSEDKNLLTKKLKIKDHQQLFLATLSYDLPEKLFSKEKISLNNQMHALVFTAIANAKPMIDFLEENVSNVETMQFRDHYHFKEKDIEALLEKFNQIKTQHKIIITTSKDAVKLRNFVSQLQKIPMYILPVKHEILLEEKQKFEHCLFNYLNKQND